MYVVSSISVRFTSRLVRSICLWRAERFFSPSKYLTVTRTNHNPLVQVPIAHDEEATLQLAAVPRRHLALALHLHEHAARVLLHLLHLQPLHQRALLQRVEGERGGEEHATHVAQHQVRRAQQTRALVVRQRQLGGEVRFAHHLVQNPIRLTTLLVSRHQLSNARLDLPRVAQTSMQVLHDETPVRLVAVVKPVVGVGLEALVAACEENEREIALGPGQVQLEDGEQVVGVARVTHQTRPVDVEMHELTQRQV